MADGPYQGRRGALCKADGYGESGGKLVAGPGVSGAPGCGDGHESRALLAVAGAPSLVFVVGFWAIGGGMSGVLLAIGRGYVQRYCPNEILGRAAIASRTITRTAFVVGALLGGTVAVAYGVRSAFAVAGLVQAAALVPMGLALRHDRP